MTGSLIENARPRTAVESGDPGVVAAIGPSRGCGDRSAGNLRVLQTELTGAGILERCYRHHRARLGVGGRRKRIATQPEFSLLTSQRCGVARLGTALAAGRRLGDAQPWVDGQLTGSASEGSRCGCMRAACRCRCCVPRLSQPRWLRQARSTRGRRAGRRHRHRPAGIPRAAERCQEDALRQRCWAPCRPMSRIVCVGDNRPGPSASTSWSAGCAACERRRIWW